MVIAGALAHDAAALILGHGHPSGDATPSPADLAYTRALARVCAAVEVELLDHLILAGDRITSLRALGMVFNEAASVAPDCVRHFVRHRQRLMTKKLVQILHPCVGQADQLPN
ncbi:hypothetical protein WR25_05747 [Diploscapter pachys]|uniref:MPN domain-containing protein n=1 Tax=Diploscapter pachys TaxID=2018661 RepID=A0A2A2M222_9BILA|nr:hypothetical protein WR25_05747 [Diploscapter pachys]